MVYPICPECSSKLIVYSSTKDRFIEFELGIAPVKIRIGEKVRRKEYKCLVCGNKFCA